MFKIMCTNNNINMLVSNENLGGDPTPNREKGIHRDLPKTGA